jgi:hypothetical protein
MISNKELTNRKDPYSIETLMELKAGTELSKTSSIDPMLPSVKSKGMKDQKKELKRSTTME